MSVTNIEKNHVNHTMVVTCEFEAPVEEVWELWNDPRKLERWWGPPGYPATFVDHEFRAGGRVTYYMTSPEGDKYHGYWDVQEVNAPKDFFVIDGFGDDSGQPNPDMPRSHMSTVLNAKGESTEVVMTTKFESAEAMQQLIEMGMEEGLRQAIGQIDAILYN